MRRMRGLRAVAASIAVAGIGVVAVATLERAAFDPRGAGVPGTEREYSSGVQEPTAPEAPVATLIG